jgi:putative endopeptidase
LGLAAASAFAEELTPENWGAFGIQTQWMDPALRPGNDFDGYVNGKWKDTVVIPEDETDAGAFLTVQDLAEAQLRKILDELVASNPAAGSPEGRIVAAYGAFMDTAAIDAAGLAPARPYLDRILAACTTEDLVRLFATPGFASPIDVDIDADQKRSDINALYISQAALGLPDRDYYLSDSQHYKDIRAKYLDHLAFLLGKAGYSNPRAAADSVLALEVRLAGATWDRTMERNSDLTYNKLSAAELDALAPDGLMRTFLDTLGAKADSAIVLQLPPTPDELAAAKITPEISAAKLGGGVPATFRLVKETPLTTWRAWLAAHFLRKHAAFLPKEIDDADFAFHGTVLLGQLEQRARWRRGIETVQGQIGELLGRIYAERYYPAENKAAMTELVSNLRKAMAANLAGLEWMGPLTRRQAEAKLAAFTSKIGAPETYKTYDGLAISPTAPLANQIAARKWTRDYKLARLGKPVDRGEWVMLPQTVNAYYNPTFNEIVFPAAILQPPFFNVSADPAVNYGAIGAVIGHEIGHGFDDEGAKYDATGNLRDWWTPQDKTAFEALTSKLVGQYNRFCLFDENSPGGKVCVNGQFTLGENIGDLGGLSLAYRAYKLSLGGKEAPVIDGYTGDQRFFMAYAQVWRNKMRDEAARQLLVTDPHSPPHYRINGIVRNLDEWYRAFDVKPGDQLYLPPDQRVRIW